MLNIKQFSTIPTLKFPLPKRCIFSNIKPVHINIEHYAIPLEFHFASKILHRVMVHQRSIRGSIIFLPKKRTHPHLIWEHLMAKQNRTRNSYDFGALSIFPIVAWGIFSLFSTDEDEPTEDGNTLKYHLYVNFSKS